MNSSQHRIIFRADGNNNIGFGHITRSLALADMIKSDFYSIFATKQQSSFIANEIDRVCNELVIINDDANFFSLLKEKDIVVLDGYTFDSDYMESIINRKARLVYIDDLHNKYCPADMIINHSPLANKMQYRTLTSAHTKFLLGFDYALLREPFLKSAEENNIRTKCLKVLICMGGADPFNLSEMILKAALISGLFEEIHLVVSAEKAETLKQNDKNVFIHTRLNAEEMAMLMSANDLLIAPASSVCIEGIASHMNILGGYYADNQVELYHYLQQHKIIYGVNNLNEISKEELIDSIKQSISFFDKKEQVSNIIDGKQKSRFTEAFNSFTYE